MIFISISMKTSTGLISVMGNTVPSFRKKYSITESGWYQIFNTSFNSQCLSCMISNTRGSGQSDSFIFAINAVFSNYTLYANIVQLNDCSRLINFFDKIRIYYFEGFHIDIHKNNEVTNNVEFSIFGISLSPTDCTCSMPKETTIIEDPGENVVEYNIIKNGGLIANRSIADGSGNNIEDTYATKTELNIHEVQYIYNVSTEEELNNAAITFFNNTPIKSSFEGIIESINDNLILSGGTWYVQGFRAREDHAFMTVRRYGGERIIEFYKVMNNGIWTEWIEKS